MAFQLYKAIYNCITCITIYQVLPSDLFGCFKWPPFGLSKGHLEEADKTYIPKMVTFLSNKIPGKPKKMPEPSITEDRRCFVVDRYRLTWVSNQPRVGDLITPNVSREMAIYGWMEAKLRSPRLQGWTFSELHSQKKNTKLKGAVGVSGTTKDLASNL